jgi:phage terminase large subunit-like protein
LATAVAPQRKQRRRSVDTPPPERPAREMGKYEKLAYARHERDLALSLSPAGHPKGFWFDEAAAQRAIRFVEGFCRHFEGEWAGQPLTLEEWQRFVFRCVFGWKRADGTRRFRIAYQEVPRKNGKSTVAAGVANFLTFGDQEPGAQVYSTATKEDQAKIVWNAARSMVKHSPDLKRFATLRQKAIVCDRLESSYKPLGSDSDTLDGLNPHGHLCDELHAHKDRKMWDVMITGMAARRQPLTFVITTAGIYEAESIGWQQHEHATKVLEGVVEDDEFFAIIFAADEGDDYTDPATWAKANPNYGVSVKPDYLRHQCHTASVQPSFLNTFLRLHLNRWTQQRDRWIRIEQWNDCDTDCSRADAIAREEALAGLACFGAFDLSTKLDLTAIVLVFPDTWDLVCRFFVPADNVQQRVTKDRVPYDAWIRDGWLLATPGNVVDYAFIRAEAVRLSQAYNVREWAFDPWNATETATTLGEEGLTMVECAQGFRSMSEPSKKFEELIVAKQLRHGGHPVLRWMVSNVAKREDPAGNIKPDKAASSDRIDGVVASIMALGRAIVAPPEHDGGWLMADLTGDVQ